MNTNYDGKTKITTAIDGSTHVHKIPRKIIFKSSKSNKNKLNRFKDKIGLAESIYKIDTSTTHKSIFNENVIINNE